MARKRATLGQDRTAADPWTKIQVEAEVLLGKVQVFGAPVTWEDHFHHAVLTGAHFTEIHARPLPTGEWWTIYTSPEATALHLPVGARPKGPPRIEVVEGPDRWAAAEALRILLRTYLREHGPAIHVRLPASPVEHVLRRLNQDLGDVLHGDDPLGHGREMVEVANLLRAVVAEVDDFTATMGEAAEALGCDPTRVYQYRDDGRLLCRRDPGRDRWMVSASSMAKLKLVLARKHEPRAARGTVGRYAANKGIDREPPQALNRA